jgi:hypothetical protein
MGSIVPDTGVSHPMASIADCCARATTGHAAAQPSPAMNSHIALYLTRLIPNGRL